MAEQIIDWQEEANAIIKDVKNHVKIIEISDKLITDGSNIFINLTTLEGSNMTILLDSSGFHIVSDHLNSCDKEDKEGSETIAYETIYALLEHNSNEYRKSFGNELIAKLNKDE